MFFYIYKITNKLNGKIYIGVHKTKDLNDGYFGSGKILGRAIEKHGRENFEKEILEFFSSYEEALEKEKETVTDEFLLREDVYNVRRGGTGGFDYINKKGLNYLKTNPGIGEKNNFYGKTHSEETKALLSEYRKKQVMPQRTQEHNEKIRNALKGKKHTKERCENISKAKKGKPAANKGKPAPKHYCVHCQKDIAGYSNFSRWHGNNCKEKK